MPAQSRAQRRRANTRQQRPVTVPKTYTVPNTGETQVFDETPIEVAPEVPVPTMPVAASNSRVARRLRTRSAPAPVDYTSDYRDVSKDLRLILLWSVLLFIAMFAIYFARANGMF